MADEITNPNDARSRHAAAIKAWHDAKDDAERAKAVAAFPELVTMYSAAQNFKPADKSAE